VASSPDGRLLAAGNIDLRTRLFQVATGREVLSLARHERTVAAVAFGPGGRLLATADGGPRSRYWKERPGPQTIRFWDVGTGEELARLSGHGSDVTSLAFTPDGKQIAAGLYNGTALVWETPAAAQQLAATVVRKLGPKETASLWADLAGDDARVAHEAVRILAASPEQSVPFLADALKPAVKRDAAKVRRWIADLGDEEFAVREAASRELALWGENMEPELVAALADKSSPEAIRRIEVLLTALRNSPPSGEAAGAARCVGSGTRRNARGREAPGQTRKGRCRRSPDPRGEGRPRANGEQEVNAACGRAVANFVGGRQCQ